MHDLYPLQLLFKLHKVGFRVPFLVGLEYLNLFGVTFLESVLNALNISKVLSLWFIRT
jgi:hypothetical protein